MSVLSPFSAGFIYNQIFGLRYSWRNAHGSRGDYSFDFPGQSFGHLYERSDDPFFAQMTEGWDALLSDKRPLFSRGIVPKPQPVWNSADPVSPPSVATPERRDSSDEPSKDDERRARKRDGCPGTEVLAWYAPAHLHSRWDYGIHLTPVGIVKTAAALQMRLEQAGGTISRRSAVVLATYLLYCHELGHALVEDVASVLEFAGDGVLYRLREREVEFYGLMEEAFCNSLAFSCLVTFLGPKVGPYTYEADREDYSRHLGKGSRHYVPEPEPILLKDAILDAVECWMRAQPPGYSNFLATRMGPSSNGLMWLNFVRLFVDFFGFSAHNAVEAVGAVGVPQYANFQDLLRTDGDRGPGRRLPNGFLEHFSAPEAPRGYGWPIIIES